ncbi:hypothetical protein GOODEAATRI_034063 [Goodea atripinnis]|uniref:Uncharacterized protein n=1 Tax=Goodea atripinnis TaxID=208336 RepID=A0ABV0Q3A2_9TELE
MVNDLQLYSVLSSPKTPPIHTLTMVSYRGWTMKLRHLVLDHNNLLGASPHRNSPGCGENSKGGLIREQCMFHIVHSPRFGLLAPLKPSDQRFGYSSPAVYIDPVELPTDSSGGNRRVEVHI